MGIEKDHHELLIKAGAIQAVVRLAGEAIKKAAPSQQIKVQQYWTETIKQVARDLKNEVK